MQHVVDDFDVDCVTPACLNPRPRVGVVEDLSLGKVPTIGIDPAVIHNQCVVPLDSNGRFILIVSHDVELPAIGMAKPAFSVRRRGAGAPSFHGSIVTSELCIFGATSRWFENWVARITIANMRLGRCGCSCVKDTGADRPLKGVEQRPLNTPEFIEGVKVGRGDPGEHFRKGHPNPLSKTHFYRVCLRNTLIVIEASLSSIMRRETKMNGK